MGARLAGREQWQQLPSNAGTFLDKPPSVVSEGEVFSPSAEPVTAATWTTRTHVSGVSRVVLAKPASSRQPADRSARARRRSVLLSMIVLVLLIVFTVGGWLLFSDEHVQSQQGPTQPVPTSFLAIPTTVQST